MGNQGKSIPFLVLCISRVQHLSVTIINNPQPPAKAGIQPEELKFVHNLMDGWVIKDVFVIEFHMRELIRESAGNLRAFAGLRTLGAALQTGQHGANHLVCAQPAGPFAVYSAVLFDPLAALSRRKLRP